MEFKEFKRYKVCTTPRGGLQMKGLLSGKSRNRKQKKTQNPAEWDIYFVVSSDALNRQNEIYGVV